MTLKRSFMMIAFMFLTTLKRTFVVPARTRLSLQLPLTPGLLPFLVSTDGFLVATNITANGGGEASPRDCAQGRHALAMAKMMALQPIFSRVRPSSGRT
jgi:hypothetical protein